MSVDNSPASGTVTPSLALAKGTPTKQGGDQPKEPKSWSQIEEENHATLLMEDMVKSRYDHPPPPMDADTPDPLLMMAVV